MRLRTKLVLLLTLVMGTSVLGIYVIQQKTVYRSFEELEREQAARNWERCRQALEREIKHLSLLCFDWAAWDDTYKYVQGKNPEFYEVNLSNREWYRDQKIDVLYICRPDGTVYWGQVLDLETLKPTTVDCFPNDKLPADHPLLAVQATQDSEVSGLVMTELGPMMVASRPILTSSYEGPMAGVLIFGRVLSPSILQELRNQTRVDFLTWPVGGSRSDMTAQEVAAAAKALREDQVVVQPVGLERLSVFGVLKDMTGKPVLNLRAKLTRQVTARGREAVWFSSLSLGAVGVIMLGVLIVSLSRLVTAPLSRLTAYATQVGDSGALRQPLALRRKDELGQLATALNGMLTKLDEYRYSAMKMSRQAGIAEIATGVLHNIGNALTNANVLTSVMTEKASQSKVAGLAKAAGLMRQHENDLARFLAQDRQGQQLVPYLTQLANHLNQEMADHQKDLAALSENLQHIKQILAAQQSLAKPSNVVEPVDVKDAVERSLAVMSASLRRHNIQVELQAEATPIVSCDRVKLSQVVVNLLTNAKDAIRDVDAADSGQDTRPTGKGERRITVRLAAEGEKAVVEVTDTGVGIQAEDLERIFSEGFTTKRDGHGLGLHYSALAAGEMGGKLTASSAGAGKGATFRLTLPLEVARQEVAA